MNDELLRGPKEAILGPIARRTPRAVHPAAVTGLGLVPGVGAAVAAALGRPWLAVALWLLNRIMDGLDGVIARQQGRQSDLGGYLDILADFVVYAAVPIGLATAAGTTGAWIAAAVLLASFFLNTVSWAYLAAILERRGQGAEARGERTTVTMPSGLIEGAETVVLFAVMLAVPAWTVPLFWAMAAAVVVTVLQRVAWALRNL